ncbi:MAG: hypothetical protein BWY72_01193 [Bacteroidetes bacterium ADurb.Bin416]|nr:MAG: hypothetical protein BWY72_01193 [Bacteroidetes bacterium ADurb.Bin416]
MVGTNFNPILTIDEDDGRIGHVQGGYCATHEVVSPWAVDEIQLLAVPLHVKNRGENRIAILVFYREIVTYGVLSLNGPATFYQTTLEKHRFCESGFPGSRTPQQGEILNFIGLIHFHTIVFIVLQFRQGPLEKRLRKV